MERIGTEGGTRLAPRESAVTRRSLLSSPFRLGQPPRRTVRIAIGTDGTTRAQPHGPVAYDSAESTGSWSAASAENHGHDPREPDFEQLHEPPEGTGDALKSLRARWAGPRTCLAGLAAAGAVASKVAELVEWPSWLLLAFVPLASATVTWKFTLSRARTAAVAAVVAGLVALAFLGYKHFLGDPAHVHAGAAGGGTSGLSFRLRPLSLGVMPTETVIYGDRIWTLTDDARLHGIDAVHRIFSKPIKVAVGTNTLLLCGSYLILLGSTGKAELRGASDGHLIRRYPYGDGAPDSASCSSTALWLLIHHVLVRVLIPAMGKKDVKTWRMSSGVDQILFWSDRIWAFDSTSGQLVGYDEVNVNAVAQAKLSDGTTSVLGLEQTLAAVHAGASCLRRISLDSRREVGAGLPLTPDPSAFATDGGGTAAVSDPSVASISIVGDDGARTYSLPLKDVRLTGVALNQRWIVLADASASRLWLLRRTALTHVRTRSNQRLAACD